MIDDIIIMTLRCEWFIMAEFWGVNLVMSVRSYIILSLRSTILNQMIWDFQLGKKQCLTHTMIRSCGGSLNLLKVGYVNFLNRMERECFILSSYFFEDLRCSGTKNLKLIAFLLPLDGNETLYSYRTWKDIAKTEQQSVWRNYGYQGLGHD